MFTSFQAILKKNRIDWIGKGPEDLSSNETYKVEVRILEKNENSCSENDIVEFFQNSPLFGVILDLKRKDDYIRELNL